MNARVKVAAALAALVGAGALSACDTHQPPPLGNAPVQAAKQFPYFRLYWAGRKFQRIPVTQADGLQTYDPSEGSGVYYGHCESGKGVFGTGACTLPLEIQTSAYSEHSNRQLGPQWNVVLRGVPAAMFDDGDSIELYTGTVAIDVYADSARRALSAVRALAPLNAPASGPADGFLPAPRIQPDLYGPGAHLALNVAIARGALPPPKPTTPSEPPLSLHGLADLSGSPI
ncbi:MAG TPA: hypothetical protein VHX88_08720 [Solirubrobacteraceae bacterium]|nr:hypothetical protein [Solirubrobacteraceae bacterium]